ncbi:MAG: PD-(D/E)XK nuclease family protein [Phycisphaerales bacterium]|nr:PD-(D/E)XK nuclease family protein [Phycisphaerales bacterium]
MGAIDRHFLGWSTPIVESAAAWLADRFGRAHGGIDLTGVHIVVPGSRFGRHLMERLVRLRSAVIGEARTLEGFVHTALPPPPARPASPWIRRIAWMQAQNRIEDQHRTALWPAEVDESVARAISMAQGIDDLARRLAWEGLTFSDIGKAVIARELPDRGRWDALTRLAEEYDAQLREHGLIDDALWAIESAWQPGSLAGEVVLIGILEVPGIVRRILAAPGMRTHALIAAPATEEHLFDSHGAAEAAAWQDRLPDIPSDRIRIVADPDEQAQAALVTAGSAEGWGPLTPGEVVIGAPDDEVAFSIQQLAESLAPPTDGRSPMRIRAAAGVPANRSAPGRLLALIADFLADPEFPQFARILRHRDAERFVREHARHAGRAENPVPPLLGDETDLPGVLDQYASDHIHGVVDGRWLGGNDSGRRAIRTVLDSIYRGITAMLGELWLHDRPAPARPLANWAEAVVALVRAVFDGSADESTRRASDIIEQIAAGLADARSLSAQPLISPGAAIRLVLSDLGTHSIPPPQDDAAIEVVGWLEAVHDPAPSLILTGMNQGSVPRGSSGDAIIPQRLRVALGISTRESTLARDACLLMQAISCRTRVLLLAGRQSRDGTRLWPSRLLLGNDDRSAIGGLRQFLTKHSAPLAVTPRLASRTIDAPPFELLPLGHAEPVRAVSITSFKRYLESPYAFYIQHVLGLEEMQAEQLEMEGSHFGIFIHKVLNSFAVGPARSSTDAVQIEAEVLRSLEAVVAEDVGPDPPTAVAVQLEQAIHRLKGFARWQAEHAAAGWRILHTEWKPSKPVKLSVDGQSFELRGRIDRIDIKPGDGTTTLALIDYKTGESAGDPEDAYDRKQGIWIDLQLPLYKVLAAELITRHNADAIELGYVVLPKDGKVELATASWNDTELAAAMHAAHEILRGIVSGNWRHRGPAPVESGPLAALCGISILLPGAMGSANQGKVR